MTIRSLMAAVPVLLGGWLTVLIGVGLVTDAAPGYVVLFPGQDFLDGLPMEVSILAESNWSVTLASDQAGFARLLYRTGAFLVLPAGLPGCLPLPDPADAR